MSEFRKYINCFNCYSMEINSKGEDMKVLIINTFYEGTSTGKIATGMYERLRADGNECRLLYGCGEKSPNPDFIKLDTAFDIRLQWLANQITGIHSAFSPFVMPRIERIIDEFKPDVVQLYNLHYYYLDIYRLFAVLKARNIPIVYGMLDEYPYLGYCCYAYDCRQFLTGCMHCDYRQFRKTYPRNLFRNGSEKTVQLKKKAYDGYEKLVFTAPKWVIERAEKSYLLHGKNLKIVDEYVDTDTVFVPTEVETLRQRLNIPVGNLVILDVAPSNDLRKGVRFYIEVAKMMKEMPFTFVHVGYQGSADGLPDNFIAIGFVKDQHLLAQYYSLADAFVCTSMADTMPNTCLDALSCGTPVIGFNITGIPYVAEEPLGKFVEPGNTEELKKAIMQVEKKDSQLVQKCREYALKRYSPEVYYQKMKSIYDSFV